MSSKGLELEEGEVKSILLFSQFLEKNGIHPLLSVEKYKSLEQIIKENFYLYNEDILRGVITAALEYRDNNHAVTTTSNALGDWGLIIDTIKIVLQEKRESASRNFQQLIQYGMAGDQGNVDKYLLKLYKGHDIDHLFMGVLEETKNACRQSGNEENFYMIQYFCNTLDTFRENEAKIKAALSKKNLAVATSKPIANVTTAPPTTKVQAPAESAAKSILTESAQTPAAAQLTPSTTTTTTSTTSTTHSEADLLAAGNFLHDLIRQSAGNMTQVQETVLQALQTNRFPITAIQQVLSDNITACEQAKYVNKLKLFQLLEKLVQKHLQQQANRTNDVETSLQRLAEEQQEQSTLQHLSSLTSHHAPQFVTNNTLYDQYEENGGEGGKDGKPVGSWKTKLPPQQLSSEDCFDGRKLDFYNHPTTTTDGSSSSGNTKMNPKKLKATKKLYKHKLNSLLQEINNHLDKHGYVVVDSFVPLDLVKRVRVESMLFTEFYEKSEIWIGKEANIGAHLVVPSIRGDQVLWMCGGHNVFQVNNPQLDNASDSKARNSQHFAPEGVTRMIKTSGEVEPCKLEVKASAPTRRFHALKELIHKCDSFVNSLKASNVQLEGIFERSDAMLAIYPGEGARFANHVDNTTFDGRRVTMVTYLNPNWTEAQGGALRITGRLQQRKFVPPTGSAASTPSTTATVTNTGSTAAEQKHEEEHHAGKEKKGTPQGGVGDSKGDQEEEGEEGEDGGEDRGEAEEEEGEEVLPAIVSEAQLHAENQSAKITTTTTKTTTEEAERSSSEGGGGGGVAAVGEQAVIDVLPVAGRVALFYSSEIPHEVLPSFGDRYAMTIWYYDRTERQHAIQQAKEAAAATAAAKPSSHGSSIAATKANMQAQNEAKEFIGLLMGDDEYHQGKVTRELQAEGSLPAAPASSDPSTALISSKELISTKELHHLQDRVTRLSSDAIEIVASITGAPSVQSFRDGFAMLTVQDIESMRALFRKMGLHE